MRFQLPQFIETEVKLVGPLTLRQFLWVAAGSALIFLLFLILKGVLFFTIALPIAALFLSLAFVKIEGEPLMNFVAYALSFILSPKKYIFSKQGELPIPQQLPQSPSEHAK